MGFAAVSLAACALLWAILTNDFSLTYVVNESSRALPKAYKVAALWSGQEGSLLLWAWLLSGYSFIVRLRRTTVHHSQEEPVGRQSVPVGAGDVFGTDRPSMLTLELSENLQGSGELF